MGQTERNGIDIYTTCMAAKQIARGTWSIARELSSAVLCDSSERQDGVWEGGSRGGDICILWLVHVGVQS